MANEDHAVRFSEVDLINQSINQSFVSDQPFVSKN